MPECNGDNIIYDGSYNQHHDSLTTDPLINDEMHKSTVINKQV